MMKKKYTFIGIKKEIHRLEKAGKFAELCYLIEHAEFVNAEERLKFVHSDIGEEWYETFPEYFDN